MNKSVRDWRWVLWAYFCGKVLRRKNYRPESISGPFFIFQALPNTTAHRTAMLIKLWGYQQFTVERLITLKKVPRPPMTQTGSRFSRM